MSEVQELGDKEPVGFVMPSSPEDRKKIMDAMNEISAAMTRKEGESSYIKETINDLYDKFKIPKKMLNRFARDNHKSNFREGLSVDSDYETFVGTLVPTALD
jgi:hypothetical protein